MVIIDTDKLSKRISKGCPEIIFALLHGSAREGILHAGSDVDLALFICGKPSLEMYKRISTIVQSETPSAEVDIGILNNGDCIYGFEALKGKLLFCREMDRYLDFFSKTCREYEYTMANYERQRKYRLTS